MFDSLKKGFFLVSMLFVCVGFLGLGMLKLMSYPAIVEAFQKWGLPSWFMISLGALEIILSIAIFYKPTRRIAQLIAAIVLTGALIVHLYHGESNQVYGPIVVGLLLFLNYIFDK